jgi:hypothetical protein
MRKALGRPIEAQALVLLGRRPLLQKHTKHGCAPLVGAVSDRESVASACIAVRDRSNKTDIAFVGAALQGFDKPLTK